MSSATVLLIQSIYFLFTGLWPLFHLKSFEKIPGPKLDHWLVQTVGILITLIGVTLTAAWIRNTISFEIKLLAIASAAAMSWVDFYFVHRRIIRKIYLLDGWIEVILILGWIFTLTRDQ